MHQETKRGEMRSMTFRCDLNIEYDSWIECECDSSSPSAHDFNYDVSHRHQQQQRWSEDVPGTKFGRLACAQCLTHSLILISLLYGM